MEFLQGILNRVRGWFSGIWEKTEKRDRTRFLVISGIAVVLIIAAAVMLNNNKYTEFVTINDPEQRRSVSAALSENGIRPRISGNTLLVDKSDYLSANAVYLAMADANVGFEGLDFAIYEMATGITSTDADRRNYTVFQLRRDLKATFEALPFVSSAEVIITIPQKQIIFQNDYVPPTASVALFLTTEITQSQVETIEKFVANAVGGMSPEDVMVTDQFMRPLRKESGEEDIATRVSANYEHQKRVEQDLAAGVTRQLSVIFGPSNIGVNVSAKLNFDDYERRSQEFIPVVGDDEGIVRSMETLMEHAKGAGPLGGTVGTDPNGLGMDGLDAAEYVEVMEQLMSEYDKEQNVTNYEISEVNEYLRTAHGTIEEVTVGITINEDLLEQEGLAMAADAVRRLAAAAVGLQPDQYETNVVVEYLPMLQPRLNQAEEDAFNEQKQREELYALIQTLVLYGIIGICFILLILRTFALLKPKPVELPGEILAGDVEDYSDLLEAATVSMELEVTKTPSRERVEEFIENNAEAVAHMLRTWLQDEEDKGW
ncbi:MAG: hypothetical protein LBI19_01895 [Oscillospiraceae bacterium]|nr:hypothetical protein [Oscillospiraceae bacterium]